MTTRTPRALLSPEAELLVLTAARPCNDAALRHRVDAGIDWQSLCALAWHENVAAILVRELDRAATTTPPDPARRELRRLGTTSVIHLLHLERRLHETLDCLAQAGIEAVLLKGSALAYTAYGGFAERPMGDLDVLVRSAEAEGAWELLQTCGWTWPAARWPRERYSGHRHLPPLLDEQSGVRLEIHTTLLPKDIFRFPIELLWAQAKRVGVNGRQVSVPHPLHQLLHVCVHFAWSHEMQWGSWRALRDVGAILERGEIDWQAFVALARDSQAATCAFWTLRLARRLVGATVPHPVLTALAPPRPEFLLELLERHYICNLFPSRSRCPSVRLANRLWEVGILPGWSGHGAARPWLLGEPWMADPAPSNARGGWRRAPRERLAAWLAYLRHLTASRPRSAPVHP